MYSRIAGTGSYLPEKILTNFDLERMVNTTDEWIRDRTGIERRHIAADGETTVDLGEQAARRAIEAAGVRPQDIDFIAFGTTTPDLVFPNCGVLLQERLGCRGGPAFSVETACASFLYALAIADKFVKAGEARCALVVGAETLSRITDWSDRSTAVIFADGAGAVVLQPDEKAGILSTHLHADGAYKDMLYCGTGVSKGFPDEKPYMTVKMVGSEVFKVAVLNLGKAVEEALAAQGLDKSELDWLVPQQAQHASGAHHRNRAGPRQHVGRLGAAGIGCRGARWTHQARGAFAPRGLRRRIYLGLGARQILSAARS